MGMDVGSKKGAKGDINVTPLIDIVLVLLIIFMVLIPSMLKEMTANVPKKDESDAPPDPDVRPDRRRVHRQEGAVGESGVGGARGAWPRRSASG